MFIKKDLRKIPQILDDAVECDTNDNIDEENTDHGSNTAPDAKRTKVQEPLRELRLSRRPQEFQGTVKILCQPCCAPKLRQLKSLNLYDCQISNLDGMGDIFSSSSPQLETLNLGRNPLSNIPDVFSKIQSLKHVWLYDCQLEGSLPRPLMELTNLESLRLPNNKITEIAVLEHTVDDFDSEVISQPRLKVLCLDRNLLTELPTRMKEWVPQLQDLMVRHNQLTSLGTNVLPPNLCILHVSSNQLTSLDEIIYDRDNSILGTRKSKCPNLTHIYANSNKLTHLPEGILTSHSQLQRLVVSHNPLMKELPLEIWNSLEHEREGQRCEILWQPNPNIQRPGMSNEEKDKDTVENRYKSLFAFLSL
jgi:Leucine-rich repeat (LRR) protein